MLLSRRAARRRLPRTNMACRKWKMRHNSRRRTHADFASRLLALTLMKHAKFLGTLLSSVLLAIPFQVSARQGAPPLSQRGQTRPLQTVRQLVAPPIDARAEAAMEVQAPPPGPVRFARATPVQVTPLTEGTWEDVAGGRLWRLRVVSAGATDLNFGFSTCWLPDGATLHVYSEDENYVQGPYSATDNKPHGELWTPVLPGSRAVIELFVPATARQQPQLLLSSVNRGFRDLFHRDKGDAGTAKAGACNIDVICPVANTWSNEIRSVARYSVGGVGLCTGTLVNNALGDYRPFFLTANHCEISAANASSVVVYWNFQSPSCGQHNGGSLAQNQSGAIFRAAKADVDVTLIELEEMPDPAFDVYYSGWDRSGAALPGAVGIHHPNGDEKSISFSSNPLTTVGSCIGAGNNTHWQVVWSSGVTEPGSSGSGIWDPATHRLIGTLSGGDSSCAFPTGPDCYGKFSIAWASGSDSSGRLRDWLDPLGSGVIGVSGVNRKTAPLVRPGAASLASEGCGSGNGTIDPGEFVTIDVPLRNVGLSNSANLVATLLATNGVTSPGAPQNYGVLLTTGVSLTRSFSFVATGSCGGAVKPTLVLQDGTNNLGVVSFDFRLGTLVGVLTQNFENVAAPALPAGWTTSAVFPLSPWRTRSGISDTPPNVAYAATDETAEGETTLTSPAISIATSNAGVSFAHRYDTETDWDGGVLEISMNGGAFLDILAAGGAFVSGGYSATLRNSVNPLSGRDAWTGDSGSFVSTLVNLPSSAAGKSVRLRWRLGNDDSVSYDGWYVDTVMVFDGATCCRALAAPTIVNNRHANGAALFSFDTVAGQTYVTEFKSGLDTNLAWIPLQTNSGDGTMRSVTNLTAGTTNRFYRVRTE